jgi:hypothetical protein
MISYLMYEAVLMPCFINTIIQGQKMFFLGTSDPEVWHDIELLIEISCSYFISFPFVWIIQR